ncbi:MAG TPA: ABC transporter substrate-binding protein [Deltaproteobacteria bacterium]|nr:ABC transporter substrate-binding protein [Deltaproteobacteria bacterium]HPR55585.1 ABC transporter substrate-binding protein [Deltaproteobacteria bacterium]HXK48574.1 ABC transporter substrate-binding protein [Deltaproteobacteria bacterium]
MKKSIGVMASILAVFMVLCIGSVAFADALADIKAKGVLVAGVKDAVVPFGYVDEQSKQIVGFDVDICKEIASRMGVKLELKPVTSATRIPMITEGMVDIAACTMTKKVARDDVIDFSITYFMDGQKLLVKKGSGIKSYKDLAGKKVSTAKGSTSEINMRNIQPKCTVLSFEGYPEAFLALKQGKVAAETTDSVILIGIKGSDENPDKWEIVGDFFSSEPYGIGMRENESNLRDFVNKCLMDMWRDGTYKKIYDKWLGPQTKFYMPLTWEMELIPE